MRGAFSVLLSEYVTLDGDDEGERFSFTTFGASSSHQGTPGGSNAVATDGGEGGGSGGGGEWLRASHRLGQSVRVVRSHSLHSQYAPPGGFRYDGLYSVVSCARRSIEDGASYADVFRFERCALAAPAAPAGGSADSGRADSSSSSRPPWQRPQVVHVVRRSAARAHHPRQSGPTASTEGATAGAAMPEREARRGAARERRERGETSRARPSSAHRGVLRQRRRAAGAAKPLDQWIRRMCASGRIDGVSRGFIRNSRGFAQHAHWRFEDGARAPEMDEESVGVVSRVGRRWRVAPRASADATGRPGATATDPEPTAEATNASAVAGGGVERNAVGGTGSGVLRVSLGALRGGLRAGVTAAAYSAPHTFCHLCWCPTDTDAVDSSAEAGEAGEESAGCLLADSTPTAALRCVECRAVFCHRCLRALAAVDACASALEAPSGGRSYDETTAEGAGSETVDAMVTEAEGAAATTHAADTADTADAADAADAGAPGGASGRRMERAREMDEFLSSAKDRWLCLLCTGLCACIGHAGNGRTSGARSHGAPASVTLCAHRHRLAGWPHFACAVAEEAASEATANTESTWRAAAPRTHATRMRARPRAFGRAIEAIVARLQPAGAERPGHRNRRSGARRSDSRRPSAAASAGRASANADIRTWCDRRDGATSRSASRSASHSASRSASPDGGRSSSDSDDGEHPSSDGGKDDVAPRRRKPQAPKQVCERRAPLDLSLPPLPALPLPAALRLAPLILPSIGDRAFSSLSSPNVWCSPHGGDFPRAPALAASLPAMANQLPATIFACEIGAWEASACTASAVATYEQFVTRFVRFPWDLHEALVACGAPHGEVEEAMALAGALLRVCDLLMQDSVSGNLSTWAQHLSLSEAVGGTATATDAATAAAAADELHSERGGAAEADGATPEAEVRALMSACGEIDWAARRRIARSLAALTHIRMRALCVIWVARLDRTTSGACNEQLLSMVRAVMRELLPLIACMRAEHNFGSSAAPPTDVLLGRHLLAPMAALHRPLLSLWMALIHATAHLAPPQPGGACAFWCAFNSELDGACQSARAALDDDCAASRFSVTGALRAGAVHGAAIPLASQHAIPAIDLPRFVSISDAVAWRLLCMSVVAPLFAVATPAAGADGQAADATAEAGRTATETCAPNWPLLQQLLSAACTACSRSVLAAPPLRSNNSTAPPQPSQPGMGGVVSSLQAADRTSAEDCAGRLLRCAAAFVPLWDGGFDCALSAWKVLALVSSPSGAATATAVSRTVRLRAIALPPLAHWKAHLLATPTAQLPSLVGTDLRSQCLLFLMSAACRQCRAVASSVARLSSKLITSADSIGSLASSAGGAPAATDIVWARSTTALVAAHLPYSSTALPAALRGVGKLLSKCQAVDTPDTDAVAVCLDAAHLLAQRVAGCPAEVPADADLTSVFRLSDDLLGRLLDRAKAITAPPAGTGEAVDAAEGACGGGGSGLQTTGASPASAGELERLISTLLSHAKALLSALPQERLRPRPLAEQGLLGPHLAALIQRGTSPQCAVAVRVMRTAIESAVEPQLAMEREAVALEAAAGDDDDEADFGGGGGDDFETLARKGANAIDWASVLGCVLRQPPWRVNGTSILQERLLNRYQSCIDAGVLQELVQCWAEVEWLVLKQTDAGGRVNATRQSAAAFRQACSMAEQSAARRPMQPHPANGHAAPPRADSTAATTCGEQRTRRCISLVYAAAFMRLGGEPCAALYADSLEDIERTWLCAMVERRVSAEAAGLTRRLHQEACAHDNLRQRSPVLAALALERIEDIPRDTSRFSQQRAELLLRVLDRVAVAFGPISNARAEKTRLEHMERVLKRVSVLLRDTHVREAQEAMSSTAAPSEGRSPHAGYVEFVVRLCAALLSKLPQVLLANSSVMMTHVFELFFGSVTQHCVDGPQSVQPPSKLAQAHPTAPALIRDHLEAVLDGLLDVTALPMGGDVKRRLERLCSAALLGSVDREWAEAMEGAVSAPGRHTLRSLLFSTNGQLPRRVVLGALPLALAGSGGPRPDAALMRDRCEDVHFAKRAAHIIPRLFRFATAPVEASGAATAHHPLVAEDAATVMDTVLPLLSQAVLRAVGSTTFESELMLMLWGAAKSCLRLRCAVTAAPSASVFHTCLSKQPDGKCLGVLLQAFGMTWYHRVYWMLASEANSPEATALWRNLYYSMKLADSGSTEAMLIKVRTTLGGIAPVPIERVDRVRTTTNSSFMDAHTLLRRVLTHAYDLLKVCKSAKPHEYNEVQRTVHIFGHCVHQLRDTAQTQASGYSSGVSGVIQREWLEKVAPDVVKLAESMLGEKLR